MRHFLQKFDFRSSAYERPTQQWVCGHAFDGQECRIGPDRRGRCRADYECEPKKDGDRWSCTRASSRGGTCADGPLPDGRCCRAIPRCVPVRSLRGRRGRTVTWMVVLAIGLLILAFQEPAVTRLLSPGAMTLHHGEVGSCGTCHEHLSEGPLGWIEAAFAPADSLNGSKQCLSCHKMGENALRPHSLAADILAETSKEIAARGGASAVPVTLKLAGALFAPPGRESGPLACANCHKEHRGQDFDQTSMSNGRCQSCHSVKFKSFSAGHPSFADYPFSRRTRINFDHVSHIERHFEKAGRHKAPSTCTDCHSPAADGGLMLVEGFATTCSACHLDQVEGTAQVGPKGIAFLVVPGLDLIELRARGAAVGEWPEWSEQPISPFMKALWSGDAALSSDLERLESLDLLDLTEASEADIQAIERMVWAVKRLIYDLYVSGAADAAPPLTHVLAEELDRSALVRLLGNLPFDVVRALQMAWFPNLFEELERHRQGLPVPIPGDDDIVGEGPPTTSVGPTDSDGPADQSNILNEVGDEILADDQSDILTEESDEILSEDEILAAEDDEILAEEDGDILSEEDGDILSENDILADEDEEILSDDEADILADGEEEDILKDQEIAFEDAPADTDDVAERPEDTVATAPEVDAESWTELGGWYRRDYALYYKPVGHADRFIRTWLDLTAPAFGTPAEPVAGAVFAALTSRDSPGSCVKCHSVDREADGTMNVKWHPVRADGAWRNATIFSHATHFSLLDDKGCLTCHALTRGADYAGSYKGNDPYEFASNFATLDIQTCANCHKKERAGEACILCHQYHVGNIETRAVPTEMMVRTE